MARLAPVLVTAPETTPISLAEAKAQLRVTHDREDGLITALIAAATTHVDGWSGVLGRCLITQTWRQDLHRFPACRTIRLPLAPAQAATIKYLDPDEEEQTLDAEAFGGPLHDREGPFLYLKSDEVWPAIADRPDAVRVQFIAGYGNADAVPVSIKRALLLLIGAWYENRENTAIGVSVSALPAGVAAEALLAPYRRVGV